MNRRSFLSSVIALSAAPAIVRAQSLMPGRGLIVPATLGQDALIWANSEIDRARTLQFHPMSLVSGVDLDGNFYEGQQWPYEDGKVIHIRRPLRYEINRIAVRHAVPVNRLWDVEFKVPLK